MPRMEVPPFFWTLALHCSPGQNFFLLSHLSLAYYSLAFIATKMHCWLVFNEFPARSQASWSPGYGGVWGSPVLGVGLCTCPS